MSHRKLRTLLPLFATPVLLAACGGGGGTVDPQNPGPGPGIQIAAITEAPLIKTYGLSNFDLTDETQTAWVGDSSAGFTFVGIYRFDLGGLPEDAEILSAEFKVTRRNQHTQGSPDTVLGSLYVDDLIYESEMSHPTAYYLDSGHNNFATLHPGFDGTVRQNIKSRIKAALNAQRKKLNLRMHYEIPVASNGQADASAFDFPDGGSRATLTVTYR